jgi:hypothetical protein
MPIDAKYALLSWKACVWLRFWLDAACGIEQEDALRDACRPRKTYENVAVVT